MELSDLKMTNGRYMSSIDGGYPVLYLDWGSETFCASCADKPENGVCAFHIFYEGETEHCADCGQDLVSAAGPPEPAHVLICHLIHKDGNSVWEDQQRRCYTAILPTLERCAKAILIRARSSEIVGVRVVQMDGLTVDHLLRDELVDG